MAAAWVVAILMMLTGGMAWMHNVLQGGKRPDGTHVETPQQAVDRGTPWALVTLLLALIAIVLVVVSGE